MGFVKKSEKKGIDINILTIKQISICTIANFLRYQA